MYSHAVLDHFKNPRNAGELPTATVRVEVTNPACGDILQLAAVVEQGTIRDLRFLCRGCTASIACASLLTEKASGRELRDVSSFTAETLAEELGGLPPASFHAAQLAVDALTALVSEASPS